MSNWWESSNGGWDAAATDNTDDKWATEAQPSQPSASDVATKIEQLRGGKWTDNWTDFEYWDAASNSWKGSEKDETLGKRGWWRFLFHEGKEWQPEELADHLEKQQQNGAASNGEAWNSNSGGYGTDSAAPAAAEATSSWGNWGASNDSGAQQSAYPTPSAKAYWDYQKWNVDSGVLSKKSDDELEQEDQSLFTERLGNNAGIDFAAYAEVPVDVSGDKSQNIPQLGTFEEIYAAFKEMIPYACVENVRRCMYTVPTPVQKVAVPVGLAGRDIMCCAQTGSGKTAAFLIPTIGLMMKHHEVPVGHLETPFEGKCKPDTLVMTPTRELCIQIHEEARKFCHRTGYRCCRVYGGEATKIQLEDLSMGCDLMVACPGRLQDFITREVIDVSETYVLVLDEADRMLDMGFEKQIRDIVENNGMPKKEDRQTMMFSATFPEECQKMAQDFLWDYIWIGVGIVGGAVSTVTQSLTQVEPAKKYEKLIEVLDSFYSQRQENHRCLVFVNAKDTAKWLDEQLYEKNYDTGALHGNLTQQERETNLGRFRSGAIDVMVATDVAARGLDIENVDLIVNYDMPNDLDTYVHRIGRSGRIGNRGAAITFIATDESGKAYDNPEILAKLNTIMKDAGSEIPDWLEQHVQNNGWDNNDKNDSGGDSWANWGGKDMRAGGGNNWNGWNN